MLKGARGRKGFTLIETVVTVGIVATLAAVVVPQVVKQFDQVDPTRIQNDLKNIQTAIETFNVNMSGTVPGDLDDLVNSLSTTADSSLTTTGAQALYATATGWKGPYVDFTIVDDDGVLTTDRTKITGFGATILDSFVCYNSLANTHGSSTAQGCAVAAGQKFLAMQISGLATAPTDANFISLNEMFDGVGETSPELNGRIRFDNTTDRAYYLALPLDG